MTASNLVSTNRATTNYISLCVCLSVQDPSPLWENLQVRRTYFDCLRGPSGGGGGDGGGGGKTAKRPHARFTPSLCCSTPLFSIAIFVACLCLSFGCECVIFSPARRASRKLLERICVTAPPSTPPPRPKRTPTSYSHQISECGLLLHTHTGIRQASGCGRAHHRVQSRESSASRIQWQTISDSVISE